ncbi:Transforming growth factor-beta-induced protein ig-h3 Beta ig-h3 [Fibrella aestuarina BUZ 2]|uniref:Transforming growth factor-beta-induced protein ig-h3 Beta ig-h3 n=1 Tax=Fibrella aestuarina BUZ 2 TaxID=1166018 RepID=I0KEP1_9BACT|nr:fasciclin domain-containing protein [Fibrella aestuarina]CCH02594.1 Transforming growth factor-beta-induced protein ig-h3 Beta ig-h3 [Fibrella aestuarina BUZ 2]
MNRLLLSFTVLLALLAGCKKTDDPTNAQPKTISDLLTETPTFSLLRAAVQQAGMADALKGAQLTLFAPTDDAFKAIGFSTPESFQNISADQMKAILRYHLITGAVSSKTPEVAGATNVAVEAGDKKILFVTNSADGLFVNGNRVTQPDQIVANGFVHTIGKVLMPPAADVVSALKLRTDVSLLSAAVARAATVRPDLLTILNGTTTNANLRQITVFAPNDAAFAAAGYRTVADINAAPAATLANILTYHTVQGFVFSNQLKVGQLTTLNSAANNKITLALTNNMLTVKGNSNAVAATIKEADIISGNAVIHVIDQVLLP